MDIKAKLSEKDYAKLIIEGKGLILYQEKPFITVSGLKELFFLDHRLLYSLPEARTALANGIVRLILENFKTPEIIVGVAMGAVPLATLVADKLGLPLVYVRPNTKEHARKRLVEGFLPKGAKKIIVEDVIIKAKSTINAYHALTNQKADVLGVVSIYNQKMDSMYENLNKVNLRHHSLYDIDVLLEVSKEIGYLSKERYDEIMEWRKDPENFFDAKYRH